MCSRRDINIENNYADNEFAKIRDDINSNLIFCAANEHVKRIERRIRLIKERNKCYWFNFPHTKAPIAMIDQNLFDINEWLDAYKETFHHASTALQQSWRAKGQSI